MNILMVSSFLPFPLFSGGHIRLYNLIKQLSNKHSITLICEKRGNQSNADIQELLKYCQKVITIDRKKQWSATTILTSGFSDKPFLLSGHILPEMRKAVTHELAIQSFDVIHVETFYVAQNLPETSLPIVLVEHNIEYLVYKRFVDRASFILKPLLYIDIAKLKRAEEASWKKATRLVAVSTDEKKIMNMPNVDIVPNGVDTKKFKLKNLTQSFKKKNKTVLFIGDFKWLQNKDALSFIHSHIWPQIRKIAREKNISVQLLVVGRNIPTQLQVTAPDIIYDENNTQPTEEIFANADVLIAPIRVGGGTSYKILESLAVGTPVITTPLGKEGIQVTEGENIISSSDPLELAHQTVVMLTDDSRYSLFAKNGRTLIEKEYSWDTIAKTLEYSYEKAIKKL